VSFLVHFRRLRIERIRLKKKEKMNQPGRYSSLPGRSCSSPQDRKMNMKKGPAKEVISFHKAFWFVVIMQFGYFVLLFSQAAFLALEGK